ncbi:alpha/beta hydrolase [Nocardiopsis sp. N85]|uniref:alpha/beta hydrolase n=1 Tax=Nocardiopsis sp. N85 TaxID=3029400 RepID=UPI00237F4745|nr:alpha/beta hydrolase [Nocardiopsis sp. N85]MDE3724655.1 alpha/beta hydrolase [Nocardiopsis sp. N85]
MSIAGLKLGLPEDIESDAEEVRGGAEQLYELRNTMLGHTGELDGTLQSTATEFAGAVAWDIGDASQTDVQSWQDLAELLTGTGLALGFYADAVETYKEVREDLERRWEEHKAAALLRIEEADGMLTADGTSPETAEMTHALTVRAGLLKEHDTAREEFDEEKERTEKVLTNGPDQALWERAVDRGLISGREVHLLGGEIPAEIEFGPAEDWTPQEVADWWRDLAPHQQEWAVEDYRDDLRNLDGIPIVVRDQLNREYLLEEIENTQKFNLSDPYYILGTRLDLEEIKNMLEEDDGKFLIYLDPWAEGGGQAVISNGNPDIADYVTTVVPGMSNDMGTIGLPMQRAEDLYEGAREKDPDSEHATIVWMGYNTPPSAGFSPDEAASDLVDFQEGLRATHQGDTPPHTTVLGHSFGAYVVGAADNPAIGGGLGTDKLLLVGGPGASVDHVTELSTDPEDVHIVVGDDDWIISSGFIPGVDFGRPLHEDRFISDPDTRDPVSNRHKPWNETGHSDYFKDEETMDYLTDVLTGGTPDE